MNISSYKSVTSFRNKFLILWVVRCSSSLKETTHLEAKNSKISSEISLLESKIMGVKSWELRGEVQATDRPENSLLEISGDIERCVFI